MMPAPYEKLRVWRLAHDLALQVYEVTLGFPAGERYGLVSQLRRAVVAVAANIVEGNARSHRREYIQFCHVARSSAVEMKCLLQISSDLGFVDDADTTLFRGYDHVSALLYDMIGKLEQKERTRSQFAR